MPGSNATGGENEPSERTPETQALPDATLPGRPTSRHVTMKSLPNGMIDGVPSFVLLDVFWLMRVLPRTVPSRAMRTASSQVSSTTSNIDSLLLKATDAAETVSAG